MNRLIAILFTSLFLWAGNLFSQTNQIGRLLIPFLDTESQSNVLVTVWGEKPSPPKFTNTLSNTNLFTPEQQKVIREAFVKYKNVTTNSGPPDTVLAGLYKSNFVFKTQNRTGEVENWVADFRYTNSTAHEEIRFGKGFSARFRNASNDGYNVFFTRTGSGTLFSFGEVKNNLVNGLFARFEDNHAQGMTWDFRLANFDGNYLEEYRHYTNGLVLGDFLLWDKSGNMLLEANFKTPYEFEKHRTDLKMLEKH
jgi:hypothetical protein